MIPKKPILRPHAIVVPLFIMALASPPAALAQTSLVMGGTSGTVSLNSGNRQLGIEQVRGICGSAEKLATAQNIEITVSGSPWAQSTLTDNHFAAWWQSVPDNIIDSDTSNYCNAPAIDGENNISYALISLGAELYIESSLQFPEDFEDVINYTEANVIDAVLGGSCASDIPTGENRKLLCMSIYADTTQTDDKPTIQDNISWVVFDVDTQIPGQSFIDSVTPKDGAATVSITAPADDDIAAYHLYYASLEGDTALAETCAEIYLRASGTEMNLIEGDNQVSSLALSGLVNGTRYEVCVTAIDRAGNRGVGSNVVEVLPQEECDFAECYPGGDWESGCAQLPPSLFAMMLLPLGLFVRRRTR